MWQFPCLYMNLSAGIYSYALHPYTIYTLWRKWKWFRICHRKSDEAMVRSLGGKMRSVHGAKIIEFIDQRILIKPLLRRGADSPLHNSCTPSPRLLNRRRFLSPFNGTKSMRRGCGVELRNRTYIRNEPFSYRIPRIAVVTLPQNL